MVYDENTPRIFFLQRSPVIFFIDNLEPAYAYRIILFAVNAKGRSEPTIIDDITFKGVAKFTGEVIQVLFFWIDVLVEKLNDLDESVNNDYTDPDPVNRMYYRMIIYKMLKNDELMINDATVSCMM